MGEFIANQQGQTLTDPNRRGAVIRYLDRKAEFQITQKTQPFQSSTKDDVPDHDHKKSPQ
jgi:hypothetical protein